jgi:hypothetical protein
MFARIEGRVKTLSRPQMDESDEHASSALSTYDGKSEATNTKALIDRA